MELVDEMMKTIDILGKIFLAVFIFVYGSAGIALILGWVGPTVIRLAKAKPAASLPRPARFRGADRDAQLP